MQKLPRGCLFAVGALIALLVPVRSSLASLPKSDPQPSASSVATVKFDPNKNLSSIGFSDLEVPSSPDARVLLTVGCSYPGTTPHPPDQCLVIFRVRVKDKAYCQDTAYSIVTDAKPEESQLKNYGCYPDGEYFVADLFTLWSFAQVGRLGHSGKIEFQIHKTRIILDNQALTGIHDIRAHFE